MIYFGKFFGKFFRKFVRIFQNVRIRLKNINCFNIISISSINLSLNNLSPHLQGADSKSSACSMDGSSVQRDTVFVKLPQLCRSMSSPRGIGTSPLQNPFNVSERGIEMAFENREGVKVDDTFTMERELSKALKSTVSAKDLTDSIK